MLTSNVWICSFCGKDNLLPGFWSRLFRWQPPSYRRPLRHYLACGRLWSRLLMGWAAPFVPVRQLVQTQQQLGGRWDIFSTLILILPLTLGRTCGHGQDRRIVGEVLCSLHTHLEKVSQKFAYLYEHEKKPLTLSVKRRGLLLIENMRLCVAKFWWPVSMHWVSEIMNLV